MGQNLCLDVRKGKFERNEKRFGKLMLFLIKTWVLKDGRFLDSTSAIASNNNLFILQVGRVRNLGKQ